MNKKKETKSKNGKAASANVARMVGELANEADLKSFLLNVRDKMAEEVAAPIYAISAINGILTDPEHYVFLNDENKEIARDIWLRIRQAGFQVRNPPMLFGSVEDGEDTPSAARR